MWEFTPIDLLLLGRSGAADVSAWAGERPHLVGLLGEHLFRTMLSFNGSEDSEDEIRRQASALYDLQFPARRGQLAVLDTIISHETASDRGIDKLSIALEDLRLRGNRSVPHEFLGITDQIEWADTTSRRRTREVVDKLRVDLLSLPGMRELSDALQL